MDAAGHTPEPALAALNATAGFNRWAGFRVGAAPAGHSVLHLEWQQEFGQYAGFLHAGLIAAMIDTACGFAAYKQVGNVLASHFSVNCLAPARGEAFVARARVVKAGRRQVFTSAELYAVTDGGERLVATGDAILVPVEAVSTVPAAV